MRLSIPRSCRNKLKRLEYERLRMQSTTSPTEEENSFSYDMTSNMPSAEPLDVKCINVSEFEWSDA